MSESRTGSNPIFIGGTGRSGTTLLARIIGSHPSLFCFHWETQFIVSPGGISDLIANGYEAERVEAFLEKLRGRWFKRTLRANTPGEYEAGLSTDIDCEDLERAIAIFLDTLEHAGPDRIAPARELITAIAEPAMRSSGAVAWSEKTPRNILYAPLLHRIYPNMRLIHIIRDGRDVATSMWSNGFWPIGATSDLPELADFRGEVTPEKASLYWREVLAMARQRVKDLPDDAYHELRYEDLVADPESVLERLFDWLGVDASPTTWEGIGFKEERMERWRTELTAAQVESIHRTIGQSLAAEGYSAT